VANCGKIVRSGCTNSLEDGVADGGWWVNLI
jgi:hypothetical protein